MRKFFEWINKHISLLLGFFIGVALMSGAWIYLLKEEMTVSGYPRKIVMVNVTGLINNYVTEMAKSNLTPDETNANLTDFSTRLQSAMNAVSRDEHVIVVPSQAVLAGAPDKTRVVVELMKTGK